MTDQNRARCMVCGANGPVRCPDCPPATSPADDRLRIAREALVTGYENAVNAPPDLRVRKLVDTIERALTLLQEPTDAAD